MRKVKDTRRRFVPRRKICKLYEDSLKCDFRSYIHIRGTHKISQKDASVDSYCKVLKGAQTRAVNGQKAQA